MSNLCIKLDDAKEVIKSIFLQFYGLKEDTYENEFENTISILFQELEEKCFDSNPKKKILACNKEDCKYHLPCNICELYMMKGGNDNG